MKRVLTAVLVATALSTTATSPATAAAPAPAVVGEHAADPSGDEPATEQWRSLWVDAFNAGIYSPAEVTRLVAEAREMNVNALVVQVARRYDCFCNRALYPRTDAAVAPAPYDPLDEVIAQAHAAGIEVHAWVTVNTMWNVPDGPPSAPDHIYNTHGPDATGRDRWISRMADGEEIVNNRVYLDPGHPDAVDYVDAAISSIATEYDIDGVNLDYIRYPDLSSTSEYSEWGYNDVAVARFQEATGRTDVPAPDDAEWSDWRRDQVTNLVRRVYLSLWEIDPSLRLSMDAITYGNGPSAVGGFENTRTYAEVLQDWPGWLEEGIVDTAVTMNYKRDHDPAQKVMFDEWTEFLADNQAGRHGVNGPALYLNSVADGVAQAERSVAPSEAGNVLAGWSGYSYANPSLEATADPTLRDAEMAALTGALAGPRGVFEEPADVPAMPWKTSPSDGHVTGTLHTDGEPADGSTVTLRPLGRHAEGFQQVTDGSGWFGFAHVPPGRYLVWADDGAGRPVAMSLLRVSAGEIAQVPWR